MKSICFEFLSTAVKGLSWATEKVAWRRQCDVKLCGTTFNLHKWRCKNCC